MSEPAACDADRPRIKLRSPADLLEVVPYVFGFRPTESVVVIALKGPRKRFGVQLRAGLEPVHADPSFAVRTAAMFRREGVSAAVIVVYTEHGHGPDSLPEADLVAGLREALEAQRVEITDALCVGQGRWWSYVCDDPECCPPEGTELAAQSSSRIAAEATYAGLSVLPDREAVAETLRPVGFLARRGMQQAIERANDAAVEAVDQAGQRGPDAVEELRAGWIRELRDAVDRAGAGEWLTDEEAARLIVALVDIPTRDECCGWVRGELGEAAYALWVQLSRRTVLEWDVTPLFLVAWNAWRRGGGAIVQIALERVLAIDPGHSFARLLDDALIRGVNPALLDKPRRKRRRR